MELLWSGDHGAVNTPAGRWSLSLRPGLNFEFDNVYYAPGLRLSYKIVAGERIELIDGEVSEILLYLQSLQEPAKTLADVQDQKLKELATFRYNRETAGLAVGAAFIKTDRESQAQLNSAYTGLKAGFSSSINWKSASGEFVTITLSEIEPIAMAVFSHVQDCFARENAIAGQINALISVPAIQTFDIAANW